MDIVPILSTIILISTLITLIVAIASYMTFRIKEKKKQAQMAEFSEVFSADLAELQETAPADNSAPVHTPEAVVVTPLVTGQPSQPPAPVTTVVVSPPVVMATPMPSAPPEQFPAQQQPLPQSPYPAQPMTQPQQYSGQMSYAPGQQQQPPPYQDPYGIPFSNQPPPRAPQFSGAQAAFMKGFGPENQPPQDDERLNIQNQGDYGQQPAMRRFTPPEQKPRQQPPQIRSDDSPTWK